MKIEHFNYLCPCFVRLLAFAQVHSQIYEKRGGRGLTGSDLDLMAVFHRPLCKVTSYGGGAQGGLGFWLWDPLRPCIYVLNQETKTICVRLKVCDKKVITCLRLFEVHYEHLPFLNFERLCWKIFCVISVYFEVQTADEVETGSKKSPDRPYQSHSKFSLHLPWFFPARAYVWYTILTMWVTFWSGRESRTIKTPFIGGQPASPKVC